MKQVVFPVTENHVSIRPRSGRILRGNGLRPAWQTAHSAALHYRQMNLP